MTEKWEEKMKYRKPGNLIDQEVHIQPAAAAKDGWGLKRGTLVLSMSTDQGKVVEVCNILRAEDCFACGVGDACCFFPRRVA